MTNLTEQDNAKLLTQEECLISDINERLKRLEDLYFSKGQQNIQPIDTTEGEPIETEQRWKPEKGQLYYYVHWSQKDKIVSFTWVSDETDIDFYELGNCFKSREAAQKAAEAIKQYLSTNKF
jgi:hypothetical protein